MSSSDIFIGETIGTAVLILLGGGVCAAVTLKALQGAERRLARHHLRVGFRRPDRRLHLGAALRRPPQPGGHPRSRDQGRRPVERRPALLRLGQLLGAMIGAVLVWVAYYGQFQAHLTDRRSSAAQAPATKAGRRRRRPKAGPVLGIFSTGPEIRNAVQNLATEIIGTVVLVLAILTQGLNDDGKGLGTLGALITALVVVGIGLSLGGPTGYAINPARDLGPRIVHALLPLPNKGGSDWSYAWIPVVGPLIGGAHRRQASTTSPSPRPHRPSDSHAPSTADARPDTHDLQEHTVTDAHTAGPFIAAIDQGTTSSRCIVFDRDGRIVSVDQKEHEQIFPKPGWVEHDATEIWTNVQEVVAGAIAKAGITRADIKAIGITNQRETTLLWDKNTGEPVHNAIVWQDTRTDALCRELGRNVGQDRFRRETGLPLASLLRRPQDPLAARQRRGPARARRGRRHPLRHHGLLGHLEPDRRRQRRRARHRRHQRLPHHADEPAHPGVGRRRSPSRWRPGRRAAGDPLLRRGVRQHRQGRRRSTASRSPPRSATSRRPCSARPVSPRARPSPRTAPAPSC